MGFEEIEELREQLSAPVSEEKDDEEGYEDDVTYITDSGITLRLKLPGMRLK